MSQPNSHEGKPRLALHVCLALAVSSFHFLLSNLIPALAYSSLPQSRILADGLLVVYEGLSVPALIRRQIILSPLSVDLLGLPEVAANSAIYGAAAIALARYLTRSGVKTLGVTTVFAGVFFGLCLLGYLLE